MNRDEFRQRMNNYKKARESNPSLSYWQWKANKYEKGTDEITDTTLPEVVVTPKRNYVNYPIDQDAYNSAMLDAWGKQTRIGPEDAIDYLPIVGDIKGVYDVANDFYNEEYLAGLTGLGLTLLPNIVEKPLRKLRNNYRKFKRNIQIVTGGYSVADYIDNTQKVIRDTRNKIIEKYKPQIRKEELKKFRDKYVKYRSYNDQHTLNVLQYLNNVKSQYDATKLKQLTKLLEDDPAYVDFLLKNDKMDPFSQETVDKFIQKQTTGIRGVSTRLDTENIDDRVEEYLTVNSENHPGGDRLKTGFTGIYTSNSGEIADRFSRPITSIEGDAPVSRADIALVQYPYNNNKLLPIREQLAKLRRSIYPYDLLGDANYEELADLGFIAKEAKYTTRLGNKLPGYERAYFAKETNKKLLNVLDQKTFYTNEDKHGRWALNGVSSQPELEKLLFEGYSPGYSLGDFIRFAKLKNTVQPTKKQVDDFLYKKGIPTHQITNEIWNTSTNRANKAFEYVNKLNENKYLQYIDMIYRTVNRNKFSTGTDGIVDQLKSNSRTTLTPEEQQYLLNKSKQRQRMSGAITPVFDIQDAVDFTPIGDVLTARDT